MSGLLALVSMDGRPIPAGLADDMLGAIAHRGSRPARRWDGEGVTLGHINFPSTAEAEEEILPACSRGGRYWLTWDGRLDNREELAAQLRLAPRDGNSCVTDADYALAAYERWGEGFVEHLLGDWAIVLWDSELRRLVCAKDPLGWRQVYFAERGGLLAIGSEPQQLCTGFITARPNEDYLLRFLAEVVQEPGATWLQGIRELLGGQILTVEDGRTRVRTYWSAPRRRTLNHRTPADYVAEFEQLFARAVRARLRTQGKVGVFLSGGLDSSYIAAVAAGQGANPLAITAYQAGSRWMDERDYAALVYGHLGLEHHLADLSEGWSLSSRVLADADFDEPGHPPQSPAHRLLAQAAADAGLTVVMGGEGADEWLTGHPSLPIEVANGRLRDAWRLARRKRSRGRATLAMARGAYSGLLPFGFRAAVGRLRSGGMSHGLDLFVRIQPGWEPAATFLECSPWDEDERLRREWQRYREASSHVVGWRDRHCFAPNNVDLRTPFNDLRLVEYLASVPDTVKQFRGRRKDLLREAEYAVLPTEIPDRDDFGLYSELLHQGVTRETVRVAQAVEALSNVPGVDGDAVRREVNRWLTEDHRVWEPNWRAVTAGLWLATFDRPSVGMGTATRGPAILGRKEVIPA
ncbi:MAG: asparagine synthetase B family protein [Hyphomicrobiales bacterium]